MVACIAGNTTYAWGCNITSIDSMFTYIKDQAAANSTVTGTQLVPYSDSIYGIMIFVPLWIIVFIILAKFDSKAAFTVANFTCWIVSIPLIALGYIAPAAFWVFLIITFVGGLIVYLRDRS